jgi:hypothetical protein
MKGKSNKYLEQHDQVQVCIPTFVTVHPCVSHDRKNVELTKEKCRSLGSSQLMKGKCWPMRKCQIFKCNSREHSTGGEGLVHTYFHHRSVMLFPGLSHIALRPEMWIERFA